MERRKAERWRILRVIILATAGWRAGFRAGTANGVYRLEMSSISSDGLAGLRR